MFRIDLSDLFRSSFGLYTMANQSQGNLNFKNPIVVKELVDRLNIDHEICRLVASKLSYDESKLRDEWYSQCVLNTPEVYQKYYPTPLSNHPIIHMDKNNKNNKFIIPSPILFIRGFSNHLYTQFEQYDLQNNGEIGIKPLLGDIFETHVHTAFNHFFGSDYVTKIKHKGEQADFYINHKDCDIIIETKLGLGTYPSQSLMMPENIADIWRRLYKACKQCSCSVKQYRHRTKPIISIILIGNHIT